jgi:hypothetical protein
MPRAVLPLLLTVAASFLMPAVADTRIVRINTNEGNESLGEPAAETTSTTWLAGKKLRQDEDDQSVIVDLEQKKVFVLNHAPKTYHEFDVPVDLTRFIPEAQRERYEKAVAQMAMNVNVTATDETAEIHGFASKKYLIEMEHPQGLKMHAEYWTTDQIELDVSLYKALVLEIARLQPGVGDWMERVLEIDGFPVKRDTTIDMLGQQVVSREELSVLEKKPAPDDHYRPPADYEKTQLDLSGPVGGS